MSVLSRVLWQARFFSCPLEGAHLWNAMAYVERNPVRAGLVADACEYRWSSASAHTGGAADPILSLAAWRKEYTRLRPRPARRPRKAREESGAVQLELEIGD